MILRPMYPISAVLLLLSVAMARANEPPTCDLWAKLMGPPISESDARQAVSNRTIRTHSEHGNQIEFIAANGRTRLWYPGNDVILSGQWKVVREPFRLPSRGIECRSVVVTQICFRYGTPSVNPLTGVRGTQWSCDPFTGLRGRIRETAPGDPLGLAKSTEPPFVLERADRSLAEIGARIRAR